MSKRLNVNTNKLIVSLGYSENVKNLMHDQAVSIIRELSKYQQNIDNISQDLIGYDDNWKEA
jgi:hypothetical protein